MTRSRSWLLAAVVVVAALAVVGSLVTPTGRLARAARGGLAPVVATSLVCPSVSGGPGGGTTDMTAAHVTAGPVPPAAYTPVFGAVPAQRPVPMTLKPSVVVHKSTPYGAVTVAAAGLGADGVIAGQTSLIPGGAGRGLADLTCLPPATDWWFVGTDGRVGYTDLLYLVNPADTPANVALNIWSSRGPLEPPGISGIIVPAHGALLRRVSDLAPDVQAVALHVHANSGTVSASALDLEATGNTPAGGDWVPSTVAPAKTAVVTGFMPGATYDRLDLLNPGDHDATVALRVLTPTKNFVPAGHQTVVVPAGHTYSVDLSAPIAGEAAAVVVDSDAPVSAAAMTAQRPSTGFRELAWIPAQRALGGPAGIANNVGPFKQKVSLILTAPETAGKVRLDTPGGASAVVTVPAGHTLNVDLLAALRAGAGGPGPLLVTPLEGSVYAVRTFYASGDHGPLMAAAAPMVLPTPIVLPPVVSDPRVALP
jgi:hypothetical protein